MMRVRSLVRLGLCGALAVAAHARGDDEPKPDALTIAWDRFVAADPTTKAELLAKAKATVEASDDPELKRLLALRDRARREIKVAPKREPRMFDRAIYAPGQEARVFEPDDSPYALEQEGLMQVWVDPAPYLERVRYDFARNDVVSLGRTASVEEEFWDLLAGYVPDNDLLVAWLMKQWDYDARLDALADYFSHAYCDRAHSAFKNITLYDAYRSEANLERPDTDVIAYARLILKDKSYSFPIPPTRQQSLYLRINDGFSKLRNHRTLIESAARVYVNEDAPLRDEIDGLRLRLHFLFEEQGSDPAKIAKAFVAMKDRSGFVDAMDEQRDKHREHWDANLTNWPPRRRNSRWAVANAARDALHSVGFLEE